MPVLHVTPSGVEDLAPVQEKPRSEPGDRLASYPDAPPKGEGEPAPLAAAGEDDLIVLGPPVAADALTAGTPYVVRDGLGRVLLVNSAGSGGWDWAYFGSYDSYTKDVMALTFTTDPTRGGKSPLVATNGSQSWPLHANGSATSWEWTFFADANYDASRPVIPLEAVVTQTDPDGTTFYNLAWNNGGTVMHLCADSGSWNWAYISSSNRERFTFHKFYVRRSKLTELFQATWPRSSFTLATFQTGDAFFEAITDAQARTIWGNSGLSAYKYAPAYFDCEDYSYVYKAQASKDAYVARPEYAYDVGVIFGHSPNSGHAVNVFVDPSGRVRILEPQNGSIVPGRDWADNSGDLYVPSFVLM
jgi:hypothetical protein